MVFLTQTCVDQKEIPTGLVQASINVHSDEMVKPSTLGPARYQVTGKLWVCYMNGNRLVKEIATKL